jgi:hypothetical protein
MFGHFTTALKSAPKCSRAARNTPVSAPKICRVRSASIAPGGPRLTAGFFGCPMLVLWAWGLFRISGVLGLRARTCSSGPVATLLVATDLRPLRVSLDTSGPTESRSAEIFSPPAASAKAPHPAGHASAAAPRWRESSSRPRSTPHAPSSPTDLRTTGSCPSTPAPSAQGRETADNTFPPLPEHALTCFLRSLPSPDPTNKPVANWGENHIQIRTIEGSFPAESFGPQPKTNSDRRMEPSFLSNQS